MNNTQVQGFMLQSKAEIPDQRAIRAIMQGIVLLDMCRRLSGTAGPGDDKTLYCRSRQISPDHLMQCDLSNRGVSFFTRERSHPQTWFSLCNPNKRLERADVLLKRLHLFQNDYFYYTLFQNDYKAEISVS